MRKQILGLALILSLGLTTGAAQDKKGTRPDDSIRMELLITELNLNDSQATELKEAMKSMRPSKQSNDAERPSREKMEQQRNAMETKIKSILTDAQYQKYQKLQPRPKEKNE